MRTKAEGAALLGRGACALLVHRPVAALALTPAAIE